MKITSTHLSCGLAALTLAVPVSAQTTIRINPAQDLGAVKPGVYGSNHRYANNGTGMWDPINKRSVPAFDANHRAAGLKEIRYPGGTVGNTFEWKKSIGPVELRPKMQGFSGGGSPTGLFGAPNVATFGVDEAARWWERNGVAMIYMFGLAFGTPEDAADLIEYLNSPVGQNKNGGVDWAAVRAQNGHPAPYNVRNFEIANEADGPSQRYWWPFIDSDETRAKEKLPFQEERDSFVPEFVNGGMARFEKQLVGTRDARGGTDFRDAQAVSDGTPNQTKVVRYRPHEPGSDSVFVGDVEWTRVANLQGATGNVYQIDPDGLIRFGDGTNGAIPPQGAIITASYRSRRHGFNDVCAAMKAIDPTIKVYAGYESLNTVRELAKSPLWDGMVIHPYTNGNNIPKATVLEDWHHNLMLSGNRLGHEVEEYQKLIDELVPAARRGQVRVITTEFGAIGQDNVLPPGAARDNWRSLSVGLYTAQQLMHFMDHGVPHASRHATTVGVLGPAPEFEITPTALAYQMFASRFGTQLVGVEMQGVPARTMQTVYKPGIGIHDSLVEVGHRWAPKDAQPLQLPKLTARASRDAAGNLFLMVLNQDASDNVTAQIEIAGQTARGQAQIATLNGPFALTGREQSAKIETSTLPLTGGALRMTFPAHSLTSIQLNAAR